MSDIREFLELYKDDPVGFLENCLDIDLDEWQREFLECLPHHRKISIASGHGTGKSTVVCFAILWHILFKFPQKTVVTAPSSSQLYSALWADLKRWIEALPEVLRDTIEYTSDVVRLKEAPNESFIRASVARLDQPDALQGVHSENVMLCVDESAGVPLSVFESSYGSMSSDNAKMILTGNPTRNSGYFYDTFHKASEEWKNFYVSCLDSPRVSKSYINEMKAIYGEDSAVYSVRVLGRFADVQDDGFIPLSIVQSAVNRDIEPSPTSNIVWGLDVARQGSDASALCKRKGNTILEPIKTWRKLDLMHLAGVIMHEFEHVPVEEKCNELLVDAIGIGAGLCDRIREIGVIPTRGINVSEASSLGKECANLRAELWYKAREWFERKDCKIPEDKQLIRELTMPKYKFDSKGRYLIESKDEMRRRGEKSPDLADAFCLTMASSPAILSGGKQQSWSEPLTRGLKL